MQETGIQNYQRIGPGTEHRFHVLVMMYVQLFLIGLDLKLLPSPQVTFTYKPISSHPRPHQTPHTTRRARHCTCLAQARRSPTPGGGRNAPAPAPASVRLAHSPPPFLLPAPFVRSSLGTGVLGPPGSEGMRCLFQFSFPFSFSWQHASKKICRNQANWDLGPNLS